MARLRKLFIRDKTYFTTFRTEAGLPFPPTYLMNRILRGILCKAKSLYDIEVICFKLMSNHFHMLITVNCPESVDDFILYVKRESAHAVNRLLGRRQSTVWCEGYDSPIVLDLEKCLEIISYIYSNCSESNITDNIDIYPGLSSWNLFVSEKYTFKEKRLSRPALPFIGTSTLALDIQKKLIAQLNKDALETNSFTLSPYAFLRSFESELSEKDLKEEIIKRVRSRELECRKLRKRSLPSLSKLITAGINITYASKKFGKRMICHSTEKKLRVQYISWFRNICEMARHTYIQAKNRLGEMLLPPGLFYPGGYLTANVWFPPEY